MEISVLSCSRFLFYLALIFTPLAFAGMETWAKAMMEALIFLASGLFFVNCIFDRHAKIIRPPGLWALIIFCAYLLGQFILLPAVLVQTISPSLGDLIAKTLGVYSDPAWLAISVNRKATLVEFFRVSAYGCAFFLAVQFCSRRRALQRCLTIIVIVGAFIAGQALLQKMTAGSLIYWFRAAPAHANPMGPFVYRNHFAGFMEMIFPAAFCLFIYAKPVAQPMLKFRARFVDFFCGRQLNAHTFYGLAAILMATAVFVSQSRGGVLSLSGAMIVMCLLLRRQGLLRQSDFYWLLVPLVVVGFVSMFGWQMIIERFLRIQSPAGGFTDGRLFIWHDTGKIIKDFMGAGFGVGAFADIFPVYQSKGFGRLQVFHAHNDYLEFLAAGGVVWAGAFICFVFTVLRTSWAIFLRPRSRWLVFVEIAGLSAVLAIFLHSFTDFNFFNTANGLYFFVILALLFAAFYCDGKRGVAKRFAGSAISIPLTVCLCLLMFVLLGWSLKFNSGAVLAEHSYRSIQNIYISSALAADKKEQLLTVSKRLTSLDPLEARYWLTRANIEYFSALPGAESSYQRSLALSPLAGDTLQQYGSFLLVKGEKNGEKLLRVGALLHPFNSGLNLRYARWLMQQGRILEAVPALQKVFLLTPGTKILKENLPLMKIYGLTPAEMQQTLPPKIEYFLVLGRYLFDIDLQESARQVYAAAAAMLDEGEKFSPWHYRSLAYYYFREQDYPVALNIIRKGLVFYPENAALHDQLGSYYLGVKKYELAAAQFKLAVSLAVDSFAYQWHLANVLERLQLSLQSVVAFARAAELLAVEKNKRPWHYRTLSNHYLRLNMLESARLYAQQGIANFPTASSLYVLLGEVYRRQGRLLAAAEAFKQALLLDPDNNRAAKGLAVVN